MLVSNSKYLHLRKLRTYKIIKLKIKTERLKQTYVFFLHHTRITSSPIKSQSRGILAYCGNITTTAALKNSNTLHPMIQHFSPPSLAMPPRNKYLHHLRADAGIMALLDQSSRTVSRLLTYNTQKE